MENKQILFRNEQQIKSALQSIESFEADFTRVINEFLATGIMSTSCTKQEFIQLIDDPVKFVRSIYASRIPDTDENTGLEADKDKILNTLKLPDLKRLCELVKEFNHKYSEARYKLLNLFDDKLNIVDDAFSSYMTQFNVYAKDDIDSSLFETLKAIEDNLNLLNEMTHFVGRPGMAGSAILDFSLFNDAFYWTKNGVELSERGFKYFRSRVKGQL